MKPMNSNRFVRPAAALGASAVLCVGMAGCNNAGEGALSGAGIGAAAGAILGSFGGNAGTGAAIGAVFGGIAGGVTGDQNERRSYDNYNYGYGPRYSSGYSGEVIYVERRRRNYSRCDW